MHNKHGNIINDGRVMQKANAHEQNTDKPDRSTFLRM